jgi:hypothetical protein
VALVLGLVLAGGLLAGSALASGLPWAGGPPWAGAHSPGFVMPPELAGLNQVPADQRFAHFKGARVSLTDKEGKPVSLEVTPGTASAASTTSLTVAANDGSTKSFALDDKTRVPGGTPTQGAKVVVVTLNGGTAAVFVPGDHGVGPWGGPGNRQ